MAGRIQAQVSIQLQNRTIVNAGGKWVITAVSQADCCSLLMQHEKICSFSRELGEFGATSGNTTAGLGPGHF
jgi:hypothetical protein